MGNGVPVITEASGDNDNETGLFILVDNDNDGGLRDENAKYDRSARSVTKPKNSFSGEQGDGGDVERIKTT